MKNQTHQQAVPADPSANAADFDTAAWYSDAALAAGGTLPPMTDAEIIEAARREAA